MLRVGSELRRVDLRSRRRRRGRAGRPTRLRPCPPKLSLARTTPKSLRPSSAFFRLTVCRAGAYRATPLSFRDDTLARMARFVWHRGLAALVIGGVACALAPACSAIVNPDVRSLAAARDAGAGIDASIAPREDASMTMDADAAIVVRDDAGVTTGCATPCTEGRECVGTECVCPADQCCPGCAPDQNCAAGGCESCGSLDEPCCGADTCEPGIACAGGVCRVCGALDDPCCVGGLCDGGARCVAGRCAFPDCGNAGQACCAGEFCGAGLVCQAPFPIGSATCAPCGGPSERCCAGALCDGDGLVCDRDRCQGCGGRFQPCCAGSRCDSGSCNLGRCG